MEAAKIGIKIKNSKVIITIPPIIQNSMQCLKTSNINDVTESHNVILQNSKNERLYVDNLEDFHNVLKQFYIYKKLCTVIQNAISSLQLKFGTSDTCLEALNNNIDNDTTVSSTITENSSDSKQTEDLNDSEINEASTSTAIPFKVPLNESNDSIHDYDLIMCKYADESVKCASTKDDPCLASCSHGVPLALLSDGKLLLRKRRCCIVM